MYAKVWNENYNKTTKDSLCYEIKEKIQLYYAMMAYMKYANAPSKLQCEFLQHKVSVCVISKKSCSITLEEEWMYANERREPSF